MSSSAEPATHGLPIWRATTAACDVAPPRAVMMPCATAMPWKSSGDVSMRTRMTFSPCSTHSTAVSASNTARPTAAPGEALRPLTMRFAVSSAFGSNVVAQELVDVGRLDARDRLLLGDHALVDHVGGDPHRRGRGPLGGPRLEHVQAAALDRELEVLDVAVVLLELLADALELGVDLGHLVCICAIFGAVRMPATTSSPWALVRYSPNSTFSPVFGSRVNATPVPESSPMLPKTIVTTLTAVPRSSGMSWFLR